MIDTPAWIEKSSHRLSVGGFAPFSTVDHPGKLAAVVFCQGCPWRCEYCQNPELQPWEAERPLRWERLLEFLRRRSGLLESVVFSGGEPLAQPALAAAMREVRDQGFEVGLHTAGVMPRHLVRILPLVSWVGLDIKAPRASYGAITGVRTSGDPAWESLDHLLASRLNHEVRTTYDAERLGQEALRDIGHELAGRGVRCFALQERRMVGGRGALGVPPELLEELGALFPRFIFRPATRSTKG